MSLIALSSCKSAALSPVSSHADTFCGPQLRRFISSTALMRSFEGLLDQDDRAFWRIEETTLALHQGSVQSSKGRALYDHRHWVYASGRYEHGTEPEDQTVPRGQVPTPA